MMRDDESWGEVLSDLLPKAALCAAAMPIFGALSYAAASVLGYAIGAFCAILGL